MPRVKALSSQGEFITHFGLIRMRVNGSGNLIPEFYSLDDADSVTLTSVAMSTSTSREPTVLGNFVQQRASLKLSTTEINEYFKIQRILVFTKPIASSFPG